MPQPVHAQAAPVFVHVEPVIPAQVVAPAQPVTVRVAPVRVARTARKTVAVHRPVQPPTVPVVVPTVVQPAVEVPAYSAANNHPEVLLLTGLGLVAVVGIGILACRALAGLAVALRSVGVGLAGFLRGQGRALWDLTIDDVEE